MGHYDEQREAEEHNRRLEVVVSDVHDNVSASTQTPDFRPNRKGTYMDRIEDVAKSDVAGLRVAQKSYGDSWKRRGGVGAFMMLARKWDRIELQVKQCKYDLFQAWAVDQRPEGIIDDIRDLRRYLTLVEAEILAREAGVDRTEPEMG